MYFLKNWTRENNKITKHKQIYRWTMSNLKIISNAVYTLYSYVKYLFIKYTYFVHLCKIYKYAFIQ